MEHELECCVVDVLLEQLRKIVGIPVACVLEKSHSVGYCYVRQMEWDEPLASLPKRGGKTENVAAVAKLANAREPEEIVAHVDKLAHSNSEEN